MSFASWLNDQIGFHLLHTPEERQAVHQIWRGAVHLHHNEVTKAMGVAVQSRRISEKAMAELKEVTKAQRSALAETQRRWLEAMRGEDDAGSLG